MQVAFLKEAADNFQFDIIMRHRTVTMCAAETTPLCWCGQNGQIGTGTRRHGQLVNELKQLRTKSQRVKRQCRHNVESVPYVLSHRTQQRLAVAGLLTCLIALAAELTVHIAAHMARGGNVVGGLLTYVSYYTVGSNILLVAVYAAHL